MACIRKRRGKWVVDYRDGAGTRRWVTCETKREAETVLAKKIPEIRQSTRPAVDPEITLSAYAGRWLGLLGGSVKPRTTVVYELNVRRHLLPAFGALKVRQLQRGHIKEFLAKLRTRFASRTAQVIYATLRAMLTAAVDDGVILANPANRLGRQLRLDRPSGEDDEIKAMTREQLARFLTVTAQIVPRFFALFLLFGRTGMRLGEARALQWEDLDVRGREIRVARAFSGRRLETPKSGTGRTVDMSEELARALGRLQVERKTETLRRGWPAVPPWVFCSRMGQPLSQEGVDKAFKQALKAAGLPLHFTPHSLRHTFASLLLQQGESPVYVQRQLGHASIKLTVDTYGRWLPMGNKAAVDRLDGESGSKMVATEAGAGAGRLESPNFSSGSRQGRELRLSTES